MAGADGGEGFRESATPIPGNPVCAAEQTLQVMTGQIDHPDPSLIESENALGARTATRLRCNLGPCIVRSTILHDSEWGNPQIEPTRTFGTCWLASGAIAHSLK